MSSERAISAEEASAPPSQDAAGRRKRRLPVRTIAAVLAILVSLIAYGYLGAPGLVRGEILKAISQRYHRAARLDRVQLDPLRLRADLVGFSLPDRDGRPMIAFRRLHLGLSWPSLLIGKIAFDDLSLEGPELRVVRRADGKLNLADLIPPPDKSKGKPLSLHISRFRLTDGRLEAVDAMRPTPLRKRFDRIAFSIRDFTTTANGGSYALSAQSEAGERLSWRGTLGMAPLASEGRFEFTGWRADRLAAIAPKALPFTVSSGTLDTNGRYAVALRGQALSLRLDLDQATLKAAAIRPKGAAADPVRAEAVTLSGVHADIARRTVRIEHVVLTRPDVAASRNAAGAIDLAAFVPASTPGAQTAGAAVQTAGPAWSVSAPDIRIERGRASFADNSAREPAAWTVDPLDVTVTGFAYPFAAPVQISARAAVDDGSTLTAAGSLSLPQGAGGSPSGSFELALAGLELNRFQPYLSQSARVSIAGGDAFARGRLDLTPAGAARFVGTLAVDNLQVVDPTLKSDLITWDRVEASGVDAASKPFGVKVARIVAKGAYGRVVLEPNYEINVRAALEQPGAPPPGVAALDLKPVSAPKRAPPRRPAEPINLPIDIARIDFVGSRMDFTDLTVQPHFSAGVQGLNGSITGLSARAGARAKVDLKGGVDAFAPVTITGSLEPFAADRFLDMAMQFHNMELTTFSPYSGKFAGYRIERGKLDVDLHYRIDDEHLDARHHVVINQLQLGDKVDSTEATKLPIKLIVALLKDRNGVIDLPIDVSGSLDDPKFRLWPVIWKVVGNLFGKIAASPFTLLGDLVGHGGGEALGQIGFAPGSAVLAAPETDKLMALAKALDQRPALNLEVPQTVAPGVDGPALADVAYQDSLRAAYRQAFRRGGGPGLPQALATPKLRRKLLETAYRQAFGQAPPRPAASGGGKDADAQAADALEAALRARAAASDHALQALAQARAQAVEAALVQSGHVDPRRIFVIAGRPLATGPVVMTVALR